MDDAAPRLTRIRKVPGARTTEELWQRRAENAAATLEIASVALHALSDLIQDGIDRGQLAKGSELMVTAAVAVRYFEEFATALRDDAARLEILRPEDEDDESAQIVDVSRWFSEGPLRRH